MPALAFLLWATALTGPAISFLPAQRNRQLNTGWPLTAISCTGAFTTTALTYWAGAPWQTATATGTLIYLTITISWTDLTQYRIPTETCWHTAIIGITLAAIAAPTWLTGHWWPTVLLTQIPVIAATCAWLTGAGGFGDIRVTLAGSALTSWWIPTPNLLTGYLAAAIAAIALIIFRRTKNESGKTAVPAGPVYLTIFVTAALTATF